METIFHRIIDRKENTNIYKTIDEIRIDNNLSQLQISEYIGITDRAYRYKTHNQRWFIDEIINIAKLNNNQLKIIIDDKEYCIDVQES